ncbi:DUF6916 family protein [Salisaeta longa]|uniref:DUF6916 family protein n=1 Tax=Salisaeta longa TaxID=503170 RepID=UPI0003B4DE90|nr:hypothetical protein [Salisaeta longa]
MSDTVSHEHFEGKTGETFTATGNDASLDITLAEAIFHEDEHTTGFTLLFEGAADTQLEQGMYTLTHDEAGRHEIFLVPVQASPSEPEKVHYEAVFKHLKEKEMPSAE